MRRRDLLASLGGAAVTSPFVARAQTGDRMRRMGILMAIAAEGHPGLAALRDGLAALGWVEGRNLHIDLRSTDAHPDRAAALAKQLVALRPDVLVGQTLPGAAILKRETGTIPIVGVAVADPVGYGLVASLARPDGNVTAFANFEPSIGGKWLELLKEVAPDLKRIGFMFNPTTSTIAEYLRAVETAAPTFGLDIVKAAVHSEAEIGRTIAALAAAPGAGLIVPPDVFLTTHGVEIVSLAAKHRLPAIYAYRLWAGRGGLMVYGIDTTDLFRRAASYVDRILKGARPAELPIQYPTKFEFVINLRTSKALGLTVPPALLARADEVIE